MELEAWRWRNGSPLSDGGEGRGGRATKCPLPLPPAQVGRRGRPPPDGRRCLADDDQLRGIINGSVDVKARRGGRGEGRGGNRCPGPRSRRSRRGLRSSTLPSVIACVNRIVDRLPSPPLFSLRSFPSEGNPTPRRISFGQVRLTIRSILLNLIIYAR